MKHYHHHTHLLQRVLSVLVLALLTACGGDDGSSSVPKASNPTIETFEASLTQVEPGALVELSWSVRGSTRLTLKADGVITDIFEDARAAQGSFQIWPTRTVRYTLEALNAPEGYKESTAAVRELEIKVTATAPRPVLSLSVEPSLVLRGERAQLSWAARHTNQLELTANGRPVDLTGVNLEQGLLEIVPSTGTTYVMTALGPGGRQSEEVSVAVQMPLAITAFKAAPEQVPQGQATVLRWETVGATSIQISDASGPLPNPGNELAVGELSVTPEEDTTYTLLVRGAMAQEHQAEVRVRVLARPTITTFRADAIALLAGEAVTLFWETHDADKIAIFANDVRVDAGNLYPLEGMLELRPEESTRYRLVATGPGGEHSAERDVEVLETVSIDGFTASEEMIAPGDATELSWETTGATHVSLIDSDGRALAVPSDVVDGGVTVFLSESTTFTLNASGPGGLATQDVRVDVAVDASLHIVSFMAMPESIDLGEETTLSWQIIGASELSITASPGEALDLQGRSPMAGTFRVIPEESTRYLLRAIGSEGIVEREVHVNVNQAVNIVQFEAVSETVYAEELPMVRWNVAEAASVELEWGDQRIDVESVGEMSFEGLEETTTFTLTASGIGGPVMASVTIVVVPELPVAIVAFEADVEVVPIGGEVMLTWQVERAQELWLVVRDDRDRVVERIAVEVDAASMGSMVVEGVVQPSRFVLEAFGAGDLRLDEYVDVTLESGDPSGLVLSEVFYDAVGEDEGQEWVEIYNNGTEAANLWDVVLSYGMGSQRTHTMPLRGVVRPGECVVVGDRSDAIDDSRLDWMVDFEPNLENGSESMAGGVALFVGPLGSVNLFGEPIDDVVYGSGRNSDAMGVPSGYSLVRDHVTGQWGGSAAPTPGRCFGLTLEPLELPLRDPQVVEGYRYGPEQGGNRVVLSGFGLMTLSGPVEVLFGDQVGECDGEDGRLTCYLPPGTGQVDLVLRGDDGEVRYPQWYTYASIDRCGFVGPARVVGQPGDVRLFEGWAFEVGLETLLEGALVAEWGFGPLGSDPGYAAQRWQWTQAQPERLCPECGGAVFAASVQLPSSGVYSTAFRFRNSAQEIYSYCDLSGTYNDGTVPENLFDLADLGVIETSQ